PRRACARASCRAARDSGGRIRLLKIAPRLHRDSRACRAYWRKAATGRACCARRPTAADRSAAARYSCWLFLIDGLEIRLLGKIEGRLEIIVEEFGEVRDADV